MTAAPEHREILKRIGTTRIAELSATRDSPALLRLGLHLLLVCLLAIPVTLTEGWTRLPFQFLMGVPLVFLFTAQHECIHQTAFRTRWLNIGVASVIGVILFLPALWFRYFHFAHHRHTQDPERDPELHGAKPLSRSGYLVRLTGWYFWSGNIRAMVAQAAGYHVGGYVPPRATGRIRMEARVHLAIYVTLLTGILAGADDLLTYWIVPALLGQPVLRAFVMAEHTACPMVPDMLTNTRTTFCHRAIRWLAWEMPWHTAHHAAPTVPFHRLAALSADLSPYLQSTADGYPQAHRQIITDMRSR